MYSILNIHIHIPMSKKVQSIGVVGSAKFVFDI